MSDPAITTDSVAAPPEAYQAPDPVKITPREAEPEKKLPTIKDSIASAKARQETKEKAEVDPKALRAKEPVKAPAKTEDRNDPKKVAEAKTAEPAKAEQPRENGRFVSTDPKKEPVEPAKAEDASVDHRQPLKRFSQEAKDSWATVPETAQKEVHRAFREVEAGLTKHREAATRYNDTYKEFDDIAKASSVDAKATLHGYIAIDRELHSGDPQRIVGAINEVLKAARVSPQDYARAVLGGQQQPNQQQPQAQPSGEVIELRRTVAQMQQQLGGVTEHLKGQISTQHEQTLSTWAQDKPHFERLRGEVTRLVRDEGLSPDDAYASALVAAQDVAREFLGDGTGKPKSPNPFKTAAEELDEQIARGSRSISGAPGNGSTPPKAPGKLPSIKESIARARARQ